MRDRLIGELSLVGKRMRLAAQLTALAICWLVFFVGGWAISRTESWAGLSPVMSSLGFIGLCLLVSVGLCVMSRNWFSDVRWIASRVESRFPELDSRLLTSLDQNNESSQSPDGFLQQVVFLQTLSHSSQHPWSRVVPQSKILFAQLAAISGFALMLMSSIMIANNGSPPKNEVAPVDVPAVASGSNPPFVQLVSIEPGNTDVEKGTALVVLARFKDELPGHAELVYEFASSDKSPGDESLQRISMNASFDDPVFAGQVESLSKPVTYWVEYDELSSDRFYATIFEYPELVQLDFELDYPDYTGLTSKTINDGRRVSAPKGTHVKITARLNKDVAVCQLVSPNRPPLSLLSDSSGLPVYQTEFELNESSRFQLNLLDKSDRPNRAPPEIQINALENKPPVVKVTTPRRDVEVSPLEELQTAATVADDYGVERAGISLSLAGQPTVEVELSKKLDPKTPHPIEHLIEFEALQVQPDQIISYFFWAEDRVANGQVRKVMSDMFFAEVREFDKIFRQGAAQTAQQRRQQNQQNSQQNQQRQQTAQLRELQKEIINATWKLIRRETGATPSEQFSDDIEVIQESQLSALELVDKAIEAIDRPEAIAVGAQIKDLMNQIVLSLQGSKDQAKVPPLFDAVTKEQMVYQLILQLGTNESQVRQQQQSSSSSSSSQQSRSRQQLQQLQLSNDRNRYEQENQAQLQKDEQQAEARQALNRLKELARRQQDINEQLGQLQTALEEAKSDEEKEEIERRLKRLREQQEELLRDLDELKDQAEQQQDNELMKKASQELDKARENVRRSAEALQQQKVSQAAAAGNRAQKQFEDLREEFRKGNANRFADEMEQMSQQAQQLKTNQDQISDRLRKMDESQKKSLREDDERKQVANDLIEQRKQYDSILEDIKDVVQQAEETEPLLSQQLYDTFRETSRSTTRDSINSTEDLLSRGFLSEARKIEKNATKGIESLNQGIQKAAANIVGDESESLRRAEQTLQKLNNQINSEIRENTLGNARPGEAPPNNGPESQERSPTAEDSGRQASKKQEPAGPVDPEKQSTTPGDGKSAAKKSQREEPPSKSSSSQEPSRPQQKSKGQSTKGQPGDTPGNPSRNKQPRNNPKRNEKGGKTPGQPGQGGPKGTPSRQEPSASSPPRPGAKSSDPKSGASKSGRRNDPLNGYKNLFGPSNGGVPRPITGNDYQQFSNDLREIEELLDDPKLRAQAAQIREKAKGIRVEMKRHSKEPNWDVVQEFIAEPLEVLRSEVARQLLLKENKEALVPIDRDPVPSVFEAQVQEYYKELSEVEK
ncbi:MAG: DUF4175 family protein [Planctomycetota bacterium]|nr:DUF4175 family protein [Planctomycetota bacterium]